MDEKAMLKASQLTPTGPIPNGVKGMLPSWWQWTWIRVMSPWRRKNYDNQSR